MGTTVVHDKPTEYGVFWVPADTDQKMEYKIIGTNFHELGKLVGGYIEVVRTAAMPDLKCGCQMVMVVNEEGRLRGLPQNPRAEIYYPHGPIVGDVFLIGEGPVRYDEDEIEPDFFGLPPEFNEWDGPGNPIPNQLKQPWDVH